MVKQKVERELWIKLCEIILERTENNTIQYNHNLFI